MIAPLILNYLDGKRAAMEAQQIMQKTAYDVDDVKSSPPLPFSPMVVHLTQHRVAIARNTY